MGGLANQLFQIAFGESMAEMYGCDVVYTNIEENNLYNKNVHKREAAYEYERAFPAVEWNKNQHRMGEIHRREYVPFHYVEIVPKDGTEYVGYFQSERYWHSVEFVREMFLDNISLAYSQNTCSIHVRRKDYLKLPEHHPVLSMDYYIAAIEYMERYDIKEYIVFSDDIKWCQENFMGDMFSFSCGVDYIDFWNMAFCHHNIISNSSYSLLAAILNPNPQKVVVSPKKEAWFGPKVKDSPKDLIPDYFVQL